jgi:hypothetical protein
MVTDGLDTLDTVLKGSVTLLQNPLTLSLSKGAARGPDVAQHPSTGSG